MGSLGVPPSQLRKLWRELDADGSGSVSYDELIDALAPQRLALQPKLFAPHALSGEVVRSKMRASAASNRAKARDRMHDAFGELATDRVIDVFRSWDEDGSGALSRPEFCKAISALGVQATRKELIELFNALDPDHSGFIELRELRQEIQGRRADAERAAGVRALGLR
jgi:Ca2+-binding EF-hand superfamily protein